MESLTKTVPSYALYGEDSSIDDMEFVHVEEISSRSQLYDWEIKAHTHSALFQLLIITSGNADVIIEERTLSVAAPAMVLIPSGTIHGFSFVANTAGKVISVASDFLEHNLRPSDRHVLELVMSRSLVLSLAEKPSLLHSVEEIASAIFHEYRHPEFGRTMLFDALLRTLLVLISRQVNELQEVDSRFDTQRQILERYRQLIEQRYRERWSTQDYSRALNITESKLNRVCRSLCNKSAFAVCQDRVLLEAQRYLRYTSVALVTVADELGFNDVAYFCRFFKKHKGMTPKEFRRQGVGTHASG